MRNLRLCLSLFLVILSLPASRAQNLNASISGTVLDQDGASVSGALIVLVSEDTGVALRVTSNGDGLYSLPSVVPGAYRLEVSASGFESYSQQKIIVRVGFNIHRDVQLKLGAIQQSVEVHAGATDLNFENAELRQGISPEAMTAVPLLVAGSIRSAGNFITLLPGVTSGNGSGRGAHVNGSQQRTGDAILDGSSLVNPSGELGPTGAILDFPQSPDLISEFQVLTSNYLPQYGTTAGATIVMNVRSGTNDFHGTLYNFHRDSALNATQWGVSTKPKDIENDFGGNIGGPVKLPLMWGDGHKTFFFTNFEGFRIKGALAQSTISIPSLMERQGDFRDWIDGQGNLIPIYDPATTQPNPSFNSGQPVGPSNLPFLRDQFMGCDGNTPNVICSTDPRLLNSLARQWFQFLPTPTNSQPLSNYLAPPTPSSFLASNAYTWTGKVDEYVGEKNHFSGTVYYKRTPPTRFSALPNEISDSGLVYKRTWVLRGNYDRTFSPTVLNHFGIGHNNDKYYGGGIDGPYADELPQIPGVASHAYPSQIRFSNGFHRLGTAKGSPDIQPWLAPAYIINDMVTLVKGKHTVNVGGEYRNLQNSYHNLTGQSGRFNFAAGETGLIGLTSGSPIASFLLEQVDSGTANFNTTNDINGRAFTVAIYAGDTWKATSKLTVNAGLRWELDPSPVDANDQFSYFDPETANLGAGGLPGVVAFAGSGAGKSGRRRPEDIWYKGFAPRVGFAYAIGARTVLRSGYGIYYDMANIPGTDSGITQDGYNTSPFFSSTQGGMQAAFILSDGLPQNFIRPPQLIPTFDNGLNAPIYRPRDANRLPYAQEWNLTLEHQFTNSFSVSAAYVGNKGTRLLSALAELNALDPRYLSLGQQLYDEFQPGQLEVNGISAPFPDFATTMVGCSPSVAQALLPYPHFCDGIFGRNENKGNSTYNAFQLKAEHRFSGGLWFLVSYTNSKLITDSDDAQTSSAQQGGTFSPYQHERNKSLAVEDIPQVLSVTARYDLPFGRGKRWLNGSGVLNSITGGWTISSIFRAQSGIPFYIVSSNCNVPSQFRVACLPALRKGANPFAQSKNGSFDTNRPLLDIGAFEPADGFNFYAGSGPRVSNFRGFGYRNQDIGIEKSFRLTERVELLLRSDLFNVWNLHHFNGFGSTSGGLAFDNDIASPNFGVWDGTVSNPRNVQVSGRINF